MCVGRESSAAGPTDGEVNVVDFPQSILYPPHSKQFFQDSIANSDRARGDCERAAG